MAKAIVAVLKVFILFNVFVALINVVDLTRLAKSLLL
jgi:hypothetical protein